MLGTSCTYVDKAKEGQINMDSIPASDDARQDAAIATLSKAFTVANVLATMILIAGMIVDRNSVTISVITGVAYFAISTVTVISILSGTLKAIWMNAQNQHTARHAHELQYKAQLGAEVTQTPRSPSVRVVAPLQLPAPTPLQLTGNFVPAETGADRSARAEAIGWILPLYGDDGMPNGSRINLSAKKERPGRVWAKSPSEEAINYLSHKGLIHNLGNGIRINLASCPTVNHVKEKLR